MVHAAVMATLAVVTGLTGERMGVTDLVNTEGRAPASTCPRSLFRASPLRQEREGRPLANVVGEEVGYLRMGLDQTETTQIPGKDMEEVADMKAVTLMGLASF